MSTRQKLRPVSLAIIAAISLSGCSAFSQAVINCDPSQAENDPNIKVDVVAVLAPSANFTDFQIALDVAQSDLAQTLGWEGSRLSTVLADGAPEIKKSALIEKRDNQNDGEILASQNTNQLTAVYSCAVQDPNLQYSGGYTITPETDFLQGLTVAARAFDVKASGSEKIIIVVGNGIQSIGQINFTEDGIPTLDAIPGIVEALKTAGVLPDLQGARVDWVGLGQTDGVAQAKLNQQSQDSLLAFWKALIVASNGREGTFQLEVAAGTPREGSIPVTQITALPDACIQMTLTSESGFNFQPDTAIFIDRAQAVAAAEKIAAELASKPDCTGGITVVGYTASGVSKDKFKPGDNLVLSKQRADAFTELLVQAGVTVEIDSQGGDKGPEIDWDADGNFVEELGKKNRIVVITQQ
jgi:outer membrane protein OmpA-like peptidoglycan-associated protein